MEFHPSPFVSTRRSPTGVVFYDRFTGRQLALCGEAATALVEVVEQNADTREFATRFPMQFDQARESLILTEHKSRGDYLETLLSTIDIEPAGSCNAVCGMCPRAEMTRPKTIMSQATFDALCQQLNDDFPQVPRQIYFAGFGEPLHNPALGQMSRQIRRCATDSRITVVSNGSLLTDETIESLIQSEIDVFSCSYQSNTKRRYESIMRGLNFEKTTTGLHKLIVAARGSRLRVCINITATEDNMHEIPAMTTEWQQRGIQVFVNSMHNRGGHLTIQGRDIRGDRPISRCGLMNSRLFISSEGDVLACCHDITGTTSIGNINREPLIDILNRRLNRIAQSNLFSICGKCDDASAQLIVPLNIRGSRLQFGNQTVAA